MSLNIGHSLNVTNSSRQLSLLEACAKGDLDAVKNITESDGFDVNVTTLFIYGYKRVETSPLFVAAGNCNFEIVKYLIGKGANVNYIPKVKDGKALSPLQAAVSFRSDVEFQKRKPVIEFLISNGADPSALTGSHKLPFWTLCSTKEPNLMMLLVELGMNLKERCPLTERTILHHWASSSEGPPAQEAVSVVELLLAKGTDLKALDQDGLSPLNIAAIGYLRHQTLARPNELLLRFLLGRQEFDLMDKINALELAGAMTLLHSYRENNILSVYDKAFEYWNEALDLRNSGSIPKVSLNLNNTIHWRAVEWTTRDQLEELKQRPTDTKLVLQAILVAQRILSSISSKALMSYLWSGFSETVCSLLYNSNQNTQLLEVCWIMLEGARATNVRYCDFRKTLVRMDLGLVASLKNLKAEKSPMLTSEVLKLSLELFIDKSRFNIVVSDQQELRASAAGLTVRFSLVELSHEAIRNLLTIISDESLSEIVTKEIKSCLHQFIKRDERDQYGKNLLISACHDPTNNASSLAIIRLLLEVGADPNAKTNRGYSPLHLVAGWMENRETESPIADLLLENGAHLDSANILRETPLDIWKRIRCDIAEEILLPPTWMNPVLRLSCWSARTIQHHKIPCDKLTKSDRDFVSMH